MSAHTPGPWDGEDRDSRIVVTADGFHDEIASFDLEFTCDTDEQADAVAAEQRANAALAIASPEMFAALEKVPLRHTTINGRGKCRALYDSGDLRDEDACTCWVADVRAALAKAKVLP